ncbi:DUF4865 family protein [Priestia koreensis]|uniref:DUF4865 family protein n=1 Tax=Priestia koreensis TaxID=284581 RepID=UPI001F59FA89|nr:DUF4865 family protein [Priestia koreensis]UNL83746.1 DUF4865 family protein [Priestia koreensis]
MIAMRYKISLPDEYDMGEIVKRVEHNGHKTDGFPGLKLKAYLTTEKGIDGSKMNSYAPFYLWADHEGMNTFIYEGFYDNILGSFGWQSIEIGVPLKSDLKENISMSGYVVEYEGVIKESASLKQATFPVITYYVKSREKTLGEMVIYNPDKWGYSQLSFYKEKPDVTLSQGITMYKVLHISE